MTDLAEVDGGVVTCRCTHLTNFAILVVSIPSVCVCVCVYMLTKYIKEMSFIEAHQIATCTQHSLTGDLCLLYT